MTTVGGLGPKRRAGRLPAVAVSVLTVAGALAGCEKVTRTVRSSVDPCFRILPEAHQAVGGQGRFVDVARIRGRGAARFPHLHRFGGPPSTVTPMPTPTTGPAVDARRDVCVVAYQGAFDPARIAHLVGIKRRGTYALVVVGVRFERVRAVILTDRLPPPLHRH